MKGARALAAVAAALLLPACASQIAALGPVSGDGLTGVRTASIDLLLEEGYEILRAPVCAQEAKSVSCEGALVGGAVVTVTSDVTTKPYPMTLSVDGTVIYSGDVQSVLQRAAERTSGVG
jgi:hypothetical protein